MRFSEAIGLISETFTTNDKGNSVPKPVVRQVLASKQSVRQSEFYQAAAVGLKPEIMFTIWAREYQGEKELSYNNNDYEIIRTYEKTAELLEIICTGPVV